MAFTIAQTGTASDMGGVPGDCRYVFKTATFTSTYAAGSMTAADPVSYTHLTLPTILLV